MWKEIAKFACGLTAWEATVHGAIYFWGELPMEWFGITLNPGLNTIQIFVPAAISLALGIFAWRRTPI